MNNYNKKKKDLKLLSVKLKKLEECKAIIHTRGVQMDTKPPGIFLINGDNPNYYSGETP